MKEIHLCAPQMAEPTRFRGCCSTLLLAGALLLSSFASARAQTWVSFNDHYQGNGSSNNATFWNVYTNLDGAPGNSGPLKNIANGVPLSNGPTPITLTITNLNLPPGISNTAVPAASPASVAFSAWIDWGVGSNYWNSIVLDTNSVVAHVFTGLRMDRLYSLKATAMRGAGLTNSWVLCRLEGASQFTRSHSVGVQTIALVPTLATNEAILNSGANNLAGDLFFWDNVLPANGTLVLYSFKYSGPVLLGGSTFYDASCSNAFAPVALRLEQKAGVAVSFITLPRSGSVCAGAPFSFTVGVNPNSTPPLYYQWQKVILGVSTNKIQDATNSGYTIASASASDQASYRVIVSNSVNSVTSVLASLTVQSTPVVVTTQPDNALVSTGDPTTFTLGVNNNAVRPVFVFWYQNSESNSLTGTLIPWGTNVLTGTSTASTTISNCTPATAPFYYAVVSNCVGMDTSRVASLNVYYPPVTITDEPVSQTGYLGGTVTFRVGASGSLPQYQWYRGSTALADQTNASLVLSNLQVNDAGLYHCLVTNSVSSATTTNAALFLQALYDVVQLRTASAGGSSNAMWRYNQQNVDLGTPWTATNYDDSGWSSGRGGLMVENNATVTQWRQTPLVLTPPSGGPDIVTSYFRTAFNLTNDPSACTIYTTNIFDDGIVVYLNGTEAYRYNMPDGPVTFSTLATADMGTTAPWIEGTIFVTNLPSSLLIQGTNYLAVEVHQVSTNSPDVVMALGAAAVVAAQAPLAITTQPEDLAVAELMPAVFTAGWAGGSAFIQWYKQGPGGAKLIAGANSNPLVVASPIQGRDEGQYFVVVSNVFNQVVSDLATLTVTQAPPVIVNSPPIQAGCPGLPVELGVTAYGSQYSSFQWRFNGADIPGATSNPYVIQSAGPTNTGVYSVVVSNELGQTTSSDIVLQLVSQPTITLQPQSQLGQLGGTASFVADAAGCQPLFYQWQCNGTNLSGATNPALTILNTQFTNDGAYRLVVSNAFGVATSEEAMLVFSLGTAVNSPSLTWATGATVTGYEGWWADGRYYSAHLIAGSPTSEWLLDTQVSHDGVAAVRSAAASQLEASTLRTTMVGPAKVSFWWKMSTNDPWAALLFFIDGGPLALSGATNWQQQSYYLGPGAHSLEWLFVIGGSTNQPVAWLDEVSFLTGNDLAPVILDQPTGAGVAAGSTATFRAAANGYPPLRYQWQFEGVDVPGAILPVFSVATARPGDAGGYRLRVANDFGAVTSAVATLTVGDAGPGFLPRQAYVLAVPGSDAVLHAGAFGSEPMFYQWEFNAKPLPGETNAVLVLRDVGTNQTGIYTVTASNFLDSSVSPSTELILSRVSQVIHVSVDGLAGKYLAGGLRGEPFRYPNFHRLVTEGASTLNARCDYSDSVTVPNHLCMLTGRPVLQPDGQPNTVQHGYVWDDTPSTTTTVHNSGNPNVPYKASVFDVAHDHGLYTAFFASKGALFVCAQSYDATNGAPDLIPPDNGRAKIDYVGYPGWYSSNIVDALLPSLTNGTPYNYAFLHVEDMDAFGHGYGWGSSEWFDALQEIDRQLGRIITAVESSPDPAVSLQTALILTADHGGFGSTHVDPTLEFDYTIPLMVWGPGFQTGTDLYGFFANRTDPATNRLDYNAIWQPLRNGDSGNLALALLGLPSIPGSTLIPIFPTSTPTLAAVPQDQGIQVRWSASASGFNLESSETLDSDANWIPIATGVVTNVNGFTYIVPPDQPARFFRLKR